MGARSGPLTTGTLDHRYSYRPTGVLLRVRKHQPENEILYLHPRHSGDCWVFLRGWQSSWQHQRYRTHGDLAYEPPKIQSKYDATLIEP